MKRTLDLDRAAAAWKIVHEIKEDPSYDEDWMDRYASYVESLPVTILSCGLGQAAATLLSAAKKSEVHQDPHSVLYKNLQGWLCRAESVAPYHGQADLLQAIVEGGRQDYLLAQAEALTWLEWLKKLAVAYLKIKKTGGWS